MKRTIITALAALMIATSAQAGDYHKQHGRDFGAIIAGTILGMIGNEIIRENSGHSHIPHAGHVPGHVGGVAPLPRHNPYNSPRLPGYTRGVNNPSKVCSSQAQHSGNWIIIRQYNCYGELLGVQKRARHY